MRKEPTLHPKAMPVKPAQPAENVGRGPDWSTYNKSVGSTWDAIGPDNREVWKAIAAEKTKAKRAKAQIELSADAEVRRVQYVLRFGT